MKKVLKYATGEEIPEGAVYLYSKTQTEATDSNNGRVIKCWLVWHYFLVEVDD